METQGRYQVSICEDLDEPQWDAFLAANPGGHHVQTSLWAQLKSSLGWSVSRVLVTDGARIVAGGQVLLRRVPLIGPVAYVSKGPIVPSANPHLTDLVIGELRDLAAAHRASVLFIQPPNDGEHIVRQLRQWGFAPSPIDMAPTATVLVDLTRDTEDMLASMRKSTRRDIRRSCRDGITVREGTREDLALFHQLLTATSQRRNFRPFDEAYFLEMWRIFHPTGKIKLFLSERHGETISGQIVIAFGDIVAAKQFGWSGRHGDSQPNKALDWATMQWAKRNGYHYYDLEGIEPVAAELLSQGYSIPDHLKTTPTFYKLGFGGEATLFPKAYCYTFNPLLSVANKRVFRIAASWQITRSSLDYFRTRGKGMRKRKTVR